ncbi:MAG: dinitrogenase iron-molybdenum cofactor biosynthesis protein [Chloroflexi bacterium]|nr:dinitrogenase iron-molybdenum cofactor biosynthesis protein [Chloroflexota bacterium]
MKIACITDDGRSISAHFGRAPYYAVLTVEEGRVVGREMRDKLGHQQFGAQEHGEVPGMRHGTDPASHNRHQSMAQAIADCQVLLCRGMGYGAYQSMQALGITPIVTDIVDIDSAVQAYIEGRLEDHPEKLH